MSAEEGNTGQATAPAPATKPAKNPNRVKAGKAAAQKTKEAREAQKKLWPMLKKGQKKAEEKATRAAKKEPAAAPNPVGRPAEEEKPKSDSEGLNTTQWLTLGSIAVGLIGIYYKREELKAAFRNAGFSPSTVGRPNRQTVEQPNPETAPHRGCRSME